MRATAFSAQDEAAGGFRKGAIRQSNEARILRAAERVFAQAGFAGASIAGIAELAGVPKANLLYYFKSKRALYQAVLSNILQLWLVETDAFHENADPRAAIEGYVRAKMRFSKEFPDASKVFANEIIHGAPEIGHFLRTDMKKLVADRARVIEGWVAAGRMAPIDPKHLLFMIWAATQTYADFIAQIKAVLGKSKLDGEDYVDATEQVVALILRGCGFYYDVRLRPVQNGRVKLRTRAHDGGPS